MNIRTIKDAVINFGKEVIARANMVFQEAIDFFSSLFMGEEEEVNKAVEVPEEKVPKMKPITPADVAGIPEQYVKQIGVLKAEIAKLQKKLAKLQKENELLKGLRRLELIRKIEERRRYLIRMKQRNYVRVGTDLPGDVRVFSKDNKFLGWFDSLLIGNGEIAVVISTEKDRRGKKYIVHRGPSIDALFEHSENLGDMIRHKAVVLNRLWNGLYVPEIDVYLPKLPFVELPGRLVCSLCHKEFRSFEELKEHYAKVHARELLRLAGGGG